MFTKIIADIEKFPCNELDTKLFPTLAKWYYQLRYKYYLRPKFSDGRECLRVIKLYQKAVRPTKDHTDMVIKLVSQRINENLIKFRNARDAGQDISKIPTPYSEQIILLFDSITNPTQDQITYILENCSLYHAFTIYQKLKNPTTEQTNIVIERAHPSQLYDLYCTLPNPTEKQFERLWDRAPGFLIADFFKHITNPTIERINNAWNRVGGDTSELLALMKKPTKNQIDKAWELVHEGSCINLYKLTKNILGRVSDERTAKVISLCYRDMANQLLALMDKPTDKQLKLLIERVPVDRLLDFMAQIKSPSEELTDVTFQKIPPLDMLKLFEMTKNPTTKQIDLAIERIDEGLLKDLYLLIKNPSPEQSLKILKSCPTECTLNKIPRIHNILAIYKNIKNPTVEHTKETIYRIHNDELITLFEIIPNPSDELISFALEDQRGKDMLIKFYYYLAKKNLVKYDHTEYFLRNMPEGITYYAFRDAIFDPTPNQIIFGTQKVDRSDAYKLFILFHERNVLREESLIHLLNKFSLNDLINFSNFKSIYLENNKIWLKLIGLLANELADNISQNKYDYEHVATIEGEQYEGGAGQTPVSDTSEIYKQIFLGTEYDYKKGAELLKQIPEKIQQEVLDYLGKKFKGKAPVKKGLKEALKQFSID